MYRRSRVRNRAVMLGRKMQNSELSLCPGLSKWSDLPKQYMFGLHPRQRLSCGSTVSFWIMSGRKLPTAHRLPRRSDLYQESVWFVPTKIRLRQRTGL